MPYISLPVEEIDESVKRPVVYSVTNDLMQLFGLPDNLPIVFKGNAPQAAYLRSTANYNFLNANNRYEADTYLTITEVEFEDNEHMLLNDIVLGDQPAIFEDSDLGVSIHPVYMSKKVTVNANITGSLTQVERWRSAIKRRTQQGLLNGIHTAKFHYPIPGPFMELLTDIHEAREKVAGYGESLGVWLKDKFRDTMTVLRTASGNSPVFAISEEQAPIQGWFDFGSGAPKPVKDTDMSRYSLSFTYTFYMDVPETIHVKYEYVVHNQLLNERWIIRPPRMAQLDWIKKEGSYSQQALDKFRYAASANEYTYTTRPGLPIPIFDDWKGDSPAFGYVSLIRAMVRVGSNPQRVMNYGNMGEWSLHPFLIDYLKYYENTPTLWYDCVVCSMLYRDNELMDMGKLYLNAKTTLFTEEKLQVRNRYHVVLTMLNDATLLTDKAKDLLSKHACFFKYWMNTIYPGLAERLGWDLDSCEIGSDGDTMTRDEMEDVISDATNGNHERSVWPLVGQFAIFARRLD